LTSDASNEVFKAFRAFDDFENQPLHGTFLIDGKGRIRWQDISFEPFMEHEFLLDEAKRLLADELNDEAQTGGSITDTQISKK
jgi:peroxiredoxin